MTDDYTPPIVGLMYQEGTSRIVGDTITWGPLLPAAGQIYFQWKNDGSLDLVASPNLEDFGLTEYEVYDEYTLWKEDSDGRGYFLKFDIPIEILQAIRKDV